MGNNICCSDVSGGQDPDDLSLDFISPSTTGFPEADDFYHEAQGVLDRVVDMHNSIIDSMLYLNMIGAAMMGAYRPITEVIDGRVTLTTVDAEGHEVDMAAKPATRMQLAKTLFLECQKSIAILNRENLGSDLHVRSEVKLVGPKCDDPAVSAYNRQIFTYAKELMTLVDEIDLKNYVDTFKAELNKLGGKRVTFSVKCSDDGGLQIEASRFKASMVNDSARSMLAAFKSLEDEFQQKAKEIPHLAMRCQYNVDEARVHVAKIETALSNTEDMSEDAKIHAEANALKMENGLQIIENLVLIMKDHGQKLKEYLEYIPEGEMAGKDDFVTSMKDIGKRVKGLLDPNKTDEVDDAPVHSPDDR